MQVGPSHPSAISASHRRSCNADGGGMCLRVACLLLLIAHASFAATSLLYSYTRGDGATFSAVDASGEFAGSLFDPTSTLADVDSIAMTVHPAFAPQGKVWLEVYSTTSGSSFGNLIAKSAEYTVSDFLTASGYPGSCILNNGGANIDDSCFHRFDFASAFTLDESSKYLFVINTAPKTSTNRWDVWCNTMNLDPKNKMYFCTGGVCAQVAATRSPWLLVYGNQPVVSPTAAFDYSPSNPIRSEIVQFTDNSTGSPTSWSWNFGDGGTSSAQNPTHAYAAAGSYSVTLTATNAGGSDSKTKTVAVTVPSPVANYSWSPTSPKIDQEVQFTDTSTGGPTSWSWSFGDGGTSTAQNPTHAYTTAGTFDVTLSATNAGGSTSITKALTIAAPPGAPTANFTFSPSSPKAGQEIQFSDTSTGSPTSWAWMFGDGEGAATQNPKHTFVSGGSFLVTLTASNASGSTTKSKTVTVTGSPVANFTWSASAPKPGDSVQFTDSSTGSPTSWSWDFGDGTGKSTSRNPKHTFSKAGTYPVKLTAKNAAGQDDVTKTVSVSSQSQCERPEWADRLLPTTAFGSELEALAREGRGIPEEHRSMNPPLRDSSEGPLRGIDPSLDEAVEKLRTAILASAPQTQFKRASGYRPPDYQDHFRRLKDHFEAWYPLRNTSVRETCATEIREFLEDACDHKLGPRKEKGKEIEGTLGVNRRSNHERGTALDVTVNPLPTNWKDLRFDASLHQPCSESAIHLQLLTDTACAGTPTVTARASTATVAAFGLASVPRPCDLLTLAEAGQAQSGAMVPVRILVRDPQGRRVGYNLVTGQQINEIGQGASYSGVDSDPQVVTVSDSIAGLYTVEAVAVAAGDFSLTLTADDAEEGTNFGSTSTSGTVVPGESIQPVSLSVPATTAVPSPRRRAVRH